MSILFLASIAPSKLFPTPMLADLRSALHSSCERQKFVTSFGFLALLVGYFPLLLLLNYGLEMPNDVLMMSLQLLGVAILFFLASSSRQKIAEVLDASSLCHAVPVMTASFVVEAFSDFLPVILTPPPNLQTRS